MTPDQPTTAANEAKGDAMRHAAEEIQDKFCVDAPDSGVGIIQADHIERIIRAAVPASGAGEAKETDDTEKQSRIRYQNATYNAMLFIDRINGDSVRKGTGCCLDDFPDKIEQAWQRFQELKQGNPMEARVASNQASIIDLWRKGAVHAINAIDKNYTQIARDTLTLMNGFHPEYPFDDFPAIPALAAAPSAAKGSEEEIKPAQLIKSDCDDLCLIDRDGRVFVRMHGECSKVPLARAWLASLLLARQQPAAEPGEALAMSDEEVRDVYERMDQADQAAFAAPISAAPPTEQPAADGRGWVSVKERYPFNNMRVLAMRGDRPMVASYNYETRDWHNDHFVKLDPPPHLWMDIPPTKQSAAAKAQQ